MDTCVEVRTTVNEAKKQVTACKNAQELSDIILQFVPLLGKVTAFSTKTSELSLSTCGVRYTAEFRNEFLFRHYSHFCEHILTHADPGFLKEEKFVITRLFMEGPAESSLPALVSAIASVTHTEKLTLIITLLNDFASNGKFSELFISQCLTNPPSAQQLLLVVTSLPDKLANKMKLALNATFHPNCYHSMLGKEIIKALTKVHEIACKTSEYSTLFLSDVIGKIGLRGSTSKLFDVLLPQLKEWSYTSPLWSNICSMLFQQIPEAALEHVIECLLKKITFYPFFCKIMKDGVLSNAVVRHLITNKFLLVRHYTEPSVLQNIVGYLCADSRRILLVDVLKSLLGHWSNSNTIKRSSYEQHFYVTKAIILGTVQLNSSEISEHKNELLQKMLSGVQAHLENPNSKIRQIGMVTAECMTSRLHPGNQELKFEIDEDDDAKQLRSLAALPQFNSDFEKENLLEKEIIFRNDLDEKPAIKHDLNDAKENSNKTAVQGEPDEDEDDLQPFEMFEEDDELVEGMRPPKYISQCIDGLLASDDPKRHIASLSVLTKVIKYDTDNLKHQCVQLVTILLHLQNKYSIENYNELRFSAMVELTVCCPVKIADYLTKEFYAENYSLRQRMDTLDVLAAAATKLSKPEASNNAPTSNSCNKIAASSVNICDQDSNKDWRAVLQERINNKTRRFSKKSSVFAPKASPNRFSSIAGHFFFPLLQGFDNQQNTFDLLGKDCMVLGSLAYSLGNIMYCARGSHVAQNMAKSLLELVWVLRFHNDTYVRQGLLFSLAMVVVSVPGFFLMTEVQNELAECQSWLENVLHNDPSAQCREQALQVLISIRDVFQEQFNSESN